MGHVFKRKSQPGMVAHACNRSTESQGLPQVRSQPVYAGGLSKERATGLGVQLGMAGPMHEALGRRNRKNGALKATNLDHQGENVMREQRAGRGVERERAQGQAGLLCDHVGLSCTGDFFFFLTGCHSFWCLSSSRLGHWETFKLYPFEIPQHCLLHFLTL